MRKNRHTTIFNRVFLPLLMIAVLQLILLYGILRLNGVFKNLDDSSFNLLQERTQNKQQELLGTMVNSWSNLTETEDTVNAIITQILDEQGKEWADIKTDAELNGIIVESCADELVSRLRTNKTTGIFMVLDGVSTENDQSKYAGLYIRDNDPTTNAADKSDLALVRGLPPLSRSLGISLESFWEAGFDLNDDTSENNLFFFNPLNAAKENELKKSKYGSYWSKVFKFGNPNDIDVITYSEPLLNEDGDVYGVIGVEISKNYLLSQLKSGNNTSAEEGFFYLGMTKDKGDSFECVASNGQRYKVGDFEALENHYDQTKKYVTLSANGEVIYGAVFDLKIYNNNAPYSDQQWVLIGMQDEQSLFASTKKFKEILYIAMFIALGLSGIISVLASRGIVRPIRALAQRLRSTDVHEQMKFEQTGIAEIDALSDAITSMNGEIMAAAHRTSKLIELSGVPVGVYEVKNDPLRVNCSDGFFKLLGCGQYKQDDNVLNIEQFEAIMSGVTKNPYDQNIYRVSVDGKERYIQVVSQKDSDSVIGSVMDVTKEVEERQRIEHERDYDSLTGIWNRRAFERKMHRLFEERKDSLKIGAMVMFDLDNLKYMNDAYGHDWGDSYIRTFAGLLAELSNERTVYARRSGDEFYLFVYGFESREEGREYLENYWEYMTSRVYELPDGKPYRVRVSGGISWYPFDGDTPEHLIHYADFAMYHVKHRQKGSTHEFDLKEYRADSVLFSGHEALDQLIDHQLVRFAFQPIVSAKTGEIYGYELLMRSLVKELPSPDVILRLAKAQGKLHHIERITWLKGLEDARHAIESGVIEPGKKLFLNSIANQVLYKADMDLIISKYSDLLSDLVLEVTEGEDNDIQYTSRKNQFIRAHGGSIAIDDYGTGYNSEYALVVIQSDIVKIDMTFVRNVNEDYDKQIIIKNLIKFARQRHIEVLAEGVETREEMETLIGFGVEYLQGYYLSKPVFENISVNPKAVEEIKEFNK